MHARIDRRKALTVVAALPAVAIATGALADAGEDAELRRLWAKYLEQLDALNKVGAILDPRRAAYDVNMKPIGVG
jgi:hypothetical protein